MKRSKSKVGGAYLVIVFGVIILGYIIVGGIVPSFKLTPSDTSSEWEMITPNPQGGKSSLQLDPIRFKACAGTATIDLLLDRTSSMNSLTPSNKTKIARLKEAVLQLTDKLSDTSVIGIQSFSSTPNESTNINKFSNDVPISYYKDVKTQIPDKVNGLRADGNTPTHDALVYSYNLLQTAKPLYKDRTFNFILISDGAPCPGVGCVGRSGINQDPRLFNPNPADQIKALGVNVFTLAIYDSDQARNPELKALLTSIASKKDNYFEAQNADQVANLLQQIFTRICN